MCIFASVLDDFVHICVGLGRLRAYLRRFRSITCILASVLEDYVHTYRRFWMIVCIIASVLDDSVHTCVGFG